MPSIGVAIDETLAPPLFALGLGQSAQASLTIGGGIWEARRQQVTTFEGRDLALRAIQSL